ncbi:MULTISPECIES: PilT/PilU family type 4a pilus ATPase [unclassified Thioalkalivibrio]|uniref:PilT/PilU family type 4a pilus ATPase n=1 Tax=unclassified Thioalkalivibrio TaxID=2621013 RepID=UPI000363EE0C|nr:MULTISPECIES: PilT/PilU family type 4a pilus ATPase [unclassified Thioalkalivibrio]
MDRDKAIKYMHDLLRALVDRGGSDLFITVGMPPAAKIDGRVVPMTEQKLTPSHTQALVRSLMNDKQSAEFERHQECNFAIGLQGVSRFRVNVFTQRGSPGMVLRTINSVIPKFEDIQMPPQLEKITQERRGLVIFVGGTGSGKSTSLAAMIGYRNRTTADHIVTIEDPIEFVHEHDKSIITQREVGVDTENYEIALKNTLRQAPDVILIGEIRDRETMDYGIAFAETGHLCLSTLHANSTNQALDRIINFFPEDRREQLLMDLSLNLKAVVSQRLVRKESGEGRVPAVEIMINTPLMSDLILKGEVHEMKELMSRSREQGMQTFDQALFDLYENRQISYDEALRNADSVNDLRLRIKLDSQRAQDDGAPAVKDEGEGLAVDERAEDFNLR